MRGSRRLIGLCAVAAALLPGVDAGAHEIGTTRVSVVLEEGRTYDIEIVTDAAALVEKLETLAGREVSSDTSTARLRAVLPGFEEIFRRRIKVAFDASEMHPAIAYSVEPPVDAASATAATIRLTGAIPANARDFTWTYAWTFTSYAMSVRGDAMENPVAEWLEGGQSSAPFAVPPPPSWRDRFRVARRYLALGFIHIVPQGLDHLLFVLGIYLLSGRGRSVLWQVTAFTIGHSITLALSAYGVIGGAPRVVEPLIALSIAYVAVENILLSELKWWRIALVFASGLLHGVGFAGAFRTLGLPRSGFLTALLTFNVGVETGQLAVIAAAFVLVGWHCASRDWYRDRIVVPMSTLMACTGLYWTIERLVF